MTAPNLTLCMIVRDEIQDLAAAIESVRELVDEIVVADTGSTDGTLELAFELADSVLEVPWEDDYAAVRNVCLEQARGTWILVLDADERILDRDHPLLAEAMHQPCDALRLPIRTYSQDPTEVGWLPQDPRYPEFHGYPGYVPTSLCRLFRHHPLHRYRGAVHELIEPSLDATGARIAPTEAIIHHLGRIKETRGGNRERRYQAYLRAHRRKLAQEPGSGKAHYELGINLLQLDRPTEACTALQEARRLGWDHPDARLHLLIALHKADRWDALPAALDEYRRDHGEHPDVSLLAGLLSLRKGSLDQARTELAGVLASVPSSYRALVALAEVELAAGDLAASRVLLERALALDPSFPLAKTQLGLNHVRANRPREALALLDGEYPRCEAEAIARRQAAAALFQLKDLPAATQRLHWYLDWKPDDAEAWFQLAVLEAHQGHAPAVAEAFAKAVRLAPDLARHEHPLALLCEHPEVQQ
ncbi:MAG: hypothetical protein A2284_12895 [Deltaproteobacteria bacterium RIFOXYA12_FULL_61_11]|nr:MAG: hypothetical protein A2284_12895 [Deltaproteobacteria bacterium RIFOXYA12_FULL_61_11]